MIAPFYSVTILNQSRGWQLTSVHGQPPNTDDPNVRAVLVAPLRCRWGFRDGLIPGRLDPERITFGMWARTGDDERVAELGDIVSVDVRIGTAGPRLFYVAGARVTGADAELVPTDPWAVRTTVELTGFLADLASKFPTLDTGARVPGNLLRRWARIARHMGVSIGAPAAWMNYAQPELGPKWAGPSADTLATQQLNSWAPFNVNHTLVASYTATGYPAGYTWVDNQPAGGYVGSEPNLVDPATNLRYLIVPASRRETITFGLPLQFVKRAGRLALASRPDPGWPGAKRHPALSAAVCRIPTTVRRTRDHIVNVVTATGQFGNVATTWENGDEIAVDGEVTIENVGDSSARGPHGRHVETQLYLRTFEHKPDNGTLSAIRAEAASTLATFLSDASVLAATRAFDGLEVDASAMPQDEAEQVLPFLVPHVPGQFPGGDGRVVRHVTVYSTDSDVRNVGARPGGFVSGGELVIEGGRLRYLLTTTPGQPIYPAAQGAPITVGEFRSSATIVGLKGGDIERNITAADLYLVD